MRDLIINDYRNSSVLSRELGIDVSTIWAIRHKIGGYDPEVLSKSLPVHLFNTIVDDSRAPRTISIYTGVRYNLVKWIKLNYDSKSSVNIIPNTWAWSIGGWVPAEERALKKYLTGK
jgi:hypothetical protein